MTFTQRIKQWSIAASKILIVGLVIFLSASIFDLALNLGWGFTSLDALISGGMLLLAVGIWFVLNSQTQLR